MEGAQRPGQGDVVPPKGVVEEELLDEITCASRISEQSDQLGLDCVGDSLTVGRCWIESQQGGRIRPSSW